MMPRDDFQSTMWSMSVIFMVRLRAGFLLLFVSSLSQTNYEHPTMGVHARWAEFCWTLCYGLRD
jgi:hypothetical protein